MTDITVRDRLAAYNEEGQLYLGVGAVTAVLGWLVPLLSLVAMFCGHKLLQGERHRLLGAAVLGFGVLAFLRLLVRMLAVV